MEKIAALVVTRNRLECLTRCIGALEAQTHPASAIVVVDNDSSDGTESWCKANPKISYVRQPNVGSAGGFHNGIKWILEHGYDRVWLMDDDGYADRSALEELMVVAAEKDVDWLNSLVVCINDPSRLAWGLVMDGQLKSSVSEVQAVGKLIEDANPFNGTLLHRRLIERIGNVASELFIKGDESEYHQRALRHGAKIVTVTTSLFYHPEIFSESALNVPFQSMWRFYFTTRNQGATFQGGKVKLSVRGAWTYARPVIRQLLHRIYRDVCRIMILLHAIIAAWVNDLKKRYVR